MKKYAYLRFALRILVTSLAALSIILLASESAKRRLFMSDDQQWLVDLKLVHHQSACPTEWDGHNHEHHHHHQMHDICTCPRADRALLVQVKVGQRLTMSACDAQATARGFNQTVVSYSFYGNVSGDYFQGIKHNAVGVARMYPGYVMRVYHDLDVAGDAIAAKALCELWCDNDHLDFCDVRHLPDGLCDQRHLFGMVWRFFVLGDPLVTRFLIRDIDGEIIEREVDSVRAWISEGSTWHVMRDHPYHSVAILGGMWGGTNRNLSLTTSLRKTLIDHGGTNSRGHDQNLLGLFVWPAIQNDMVSHDSFLCRHYFGATPWPTRRRTNDFVGNKFPWKKVKEFTIDTECPPECRPKEHQDWTYC